ncbi:hypothetical protein chiPu_0019285 [Chiloscyllium punctatum]|uniref:Uncharacterized protein n=1 Tax=Chiloscyllium punctatum TaxID=137246 RepID=A0A401RRG0_CHIPU|nr:hypothetical protein [Chiloscyllium punctatum]
MQRHTIGLEINWLFKTVPRSHFGCSLDASLANALGDGINECCARETPVKERTGTVTKKAINDRRLDWQLIFLWRRQFGLQQIPSVPFHPLVSKGQAVLGRRGTGNRPGVVRTLFCLTLKADERLKPGKWAREHAGFECFSLLAGWR